MNFISKKIEDYCMNHSIEDTGILKDLHQYTYETEAAPQMICGNMVGGILQLLIQISNSKNILEAINSYGGMKSAIRQMKTDQTEYSNQIIRHMEVSESLLNPQGEEIATFKNDTKGVRRLTIK